MQAEPPTSARAAATYAPSTAATDHTSAAMHGASFDAAPGAWAAPQHVRGGGAAFVTGAYQMSGDPMIDRMLRLEHALKRFGAVR